MLKVDISSDTVLAALEPLAELGNTNMRPAIEAIGMAAYDELVRLANERLTSSRARYIEGISVPRWTSGGVVIGLDEFAAMTENGYGPFDMRDTLIQPGEDFRVIRFRQKWAEADWGAGRGFGTPVGQARFEGLSEEAATTLGRRLMRALKKREAHKKVRSARGRVRRYTDPVERGAAGPKLREHHATPHYAGMRREVIRKSQVGPSGKDVEYATYRTISRNSGQGWMHPGYAGAHLIPEAQAHLDARAEQIIEGLADELLGGVG